ncbi:MAG: MFS transporter [bacterium]|nr:MFS transporter [bacterium]
MNVKSTIWSVTFVALLIVNFLRMMGQSIANTIIPLYVYDLGAVASIVGFAGGAFSITALLVRPFAGPAFDSYSKKMLFTVFGFVMAVAGFAYAFVHSVAGVIIVRLLHGIGMGCTAPLGMAIVSEILPEEKMASGIGIYSLSMAVAQAIGPAYGIWSIGVIGYALTFIIVGAFLTVTCFITIFFVEDVDKGKSLPPYQLKMSRAFSKRAIGPTIVLGLQSFAYACINSFMAIYGGLLGIEQIGLYFTVYALSMLIALSVIGKAADKYGAHNVMLPAMVIFALSFVIIAYGQSLVWILVAAVVGAFGFGVCAPLSQTIVFKCVPVNQRGSASNTIYVGMDLGMLTGPYVGGLMIEMFQVSLGTEVAGYSAMWLMMIVPVAIAIVLLVALRGRIKRYQSEVLAEMQAEANAGEEQPNRFLDDEIEAPAGEQRCRVEDPQHSV